MKSYITITTAAMAAMLVGLSDGAVRELQPRTVRDDKQIAPAEPCDAGVLQTYDAISRLESSQYDKVVNEYCNQNTRWAPSMAHKALLIAATDGHVRSQVELVKCFYDGNYGAAQSISDSRRWLYNVLAGTDVSSMHDLQGFFENTNYYNSFRHEALRLISERLAKLKAPVNAAANSGTDSGEMIVRNEDGSLAASFVNYIVEKRLNLLISNRPEAGVFEAIFCEEVLDLKTGKPAARSNLLTKAQQIVTKFPERAVEILEVGVSGLQVEICYVLLYSNNSAGKEIAAYNKTTLLVNNEGKIAGMQEILTTGDRPTLSPKYKKFNYTGPKKMATKD